MSNKFSTIALRTMLGLGALAFSGASASAAAMLPLSPTVSGEAGATDGGIVQVNHKRKHNSDWNDDWNNTEWSKKYGKRCSYYNDNCRHYYRGGYYQTPWWTLPVIIGGGIAANNYYGSNYYDDGSYDHGYDSGMSSRHVRYCLNKYRSYNPRNNTWVAYSGQVRKCYSPYL